MATLFDIRTTFLLIVVVNLSLGLTIWPVAASEKDSGLHKISHANILHGLGYLAFVLSGMACKQLLVWLGEVQIVLSIVLLYAALCEFLKIRIPVRILALPVIYNAAISLIFIDSKEGRIVFNSLSIIVVELFFLYRLYSSWPAIKGRGKILVAMSVAVNLLVLLYREEYAMFGGTVKYLFAPGPTQAALYVSVLSTLICFSVGFILMTKERTDYLNKALILKDSLTGLWNRRRLDEVGVAEVARHHRYGVPSSIALIDIDDFKKINDRFGHQKGDDVLRQVAAACQANLRETDLVGRWGGEEFMVIFPGTAVMDMQTIAEQIRSAVGNIRLESGQPVSVSIGLAACLSSDGWESWFARADAALYQAKSNGKNRSMFDFPATHADGVLLIDWTEAFETGIAVVDHAHFKLVSVINHWIETAHRPGSMAQLEQELAAVQTHIAAHFEQENGYLDARGTADAARHKAEHEALLARLRFLTTRFRGGSLSVEALSQFIVYDLCAQHILIRDKELAATA